MTDRDKALLCLAALSPSRAVPHEHWLQVGMALHEAGCSVDDWIAWHSDGAKSHERVCRQKWTSFGRTGGARFTIASLVKWAKDDSPSFRLPADVPAGLPATTRSSPKYFLISAALAAGLAKSAMRLRGKRRLTTGVPSSARMESGKFRLMPTPVGVRL